MSFWIKCIKSSSRHPAFGSHRRCWELIPKRVDSLICRHLSVKCKDLESIPDTEYDSLRVNTASEMNLVSVFQLVRHPVDTGLRFEFDWWEFNDSELEMQVRPSASEWDHQSHWHIVAKTCMKPVKKKSMEYGVQYLVLDWCLIFKTVIDVSTYFYAVSDKCQ